jgi:serine/threonine protein kinase
VKDHLLQDGSLILDRYEVISYHAEGGMQQVYRTLDTSFNRIVALKVPLNPSAERRFERSARMSARITHPNVAKTLDYFEENGRGCLVEEFVEGIDLGTLLEQFGVADPHLGAHILHHLARAVAASHHVGVVHRDLKPSNILISSDLAASSVKVTDFGIAKMAEEEISDAVRGGDDSISASKTAVGALPYMAPEMIEDSKNVRTPADIWALGALAYRMFQGNPPYGTGLKAVSAILEAKQPQRPTIWASNMQFEPLLEELWEIIKSCLERDPEKRPTADRLAEMCAELGYCSAPRRRGSVYRYPVRGGYGFIQADDGEEVFFHKESFYGNEGPKVGMLVAFGSFPGKPRQRAYPIVRILEGE